MSFIMYTDPEIKQNIIKAKRERCHISKLNRLYEKIIPTKMTRFLYHWCGRIDCISSLIKISPAEHVLTL